MKKIIAIFMMLVALCLTSCSDQKSPEKGYISEAQLNSIVNGFSSKNYTKYDVDGKLNYFEEDPNIIERETSLISKAFEDSLSAYSTSNSSLYLRVPLQITLENWTTEELNSSGLSLSTQYQLESKIYRPIGFDKIYYYATAEGGFVVKSFGVNKELKINNPIADDCVISCRGKWNIEIEYDASGYLVRETFATINYSENNLSQCCNGEAIYTFK